MDASLECTLPSPNPFNASYAAACPYTLTIMLIQHSIGDKLLPEVPDYDIFPFQDVDDVEFGYEQCISSSRTAGQLDRNT